MFRTLAAAAILTMLFGSGWFTVMMSYETPMAWLGGPFFVAYVLALSVLQYRAAFMQDVTAAKWLALGLAPLAAFFSLMTSLIITLSIKQAKWPSAETMVGLPIGPVLCVLAVINYAWAWWHAGVSVRSQAGSPPPLSPRFRMRELLLAVSGLSLVMAGGVFASKNQPVGHAAHVSPEYAGLVLPQGASDVCIARGWHDYLFYDFAIDEAGFWKWARSLGKSESGEIRTAQPVPGELKIQACSADESNFGYHTIRQGWYYDGLHERPEIEFAYDQITGRAYFAGSERH